MLKTSVYISITATTLALASCGDDFQPQPGSSSDDGTIELSLMSAPSDAGCLRVTAASTRTVTRQFNLTPGQSTVFAMDRLPVGVVSLDAVAFAGACAAVASSAVPSWVLEAPVNVQVKPLGVTQVLIKLIRNGRIAVGVDWEDPPWISTSTAPVDIAVFGDAPYGATQIADFPQFVADINAASPPVAEIVHLGDIKNGSSRCDTTYFQFVFDNLNLSDKPLLYTPGDNEWTDCHRANNGAYDPLERLATLRSMFFPVPGLSLGAAHKQVLSQSSLAGFETFVENQLWFESSVAFTMIHVVGSNNSLAPWFTDDTTGTHMDDPARRTAEVAVRVAADIDWLGQTFALARNRNAAGVVVIMQADMWDGSPLNGFDSTVQRLAELTLAFGKPVLLIEGDSHVFKVDNPMAAGDPVHGVTTPVPNLTRIVVQGSTTAPLSEWVRLHVDPAATPPFSWTRNPR
jgi:hypothetical protein